MYRYRSCTALQASAPLHLGLRPATGHEITGQMREQIEGRLQAARNLPENDLLTPARNLNFLHIELEMLR